MRCPTKFSNEVHKKPFNRLSMPRARTCYRKELVYKGYGRGIAVVILVALASISSDFCPRNQRQRLEIMSTAILSTSNMP